MCGIAGLVGWSGAENQLLDIIKSFQSSLHHRGPNSKGHWISKEDNVLFIHFDILREIWGFTLTFCDSEIDKRKSSFMGEGNFGADVNPPNSSSCSAIIF